MENTTRVLKESMKGVESYLEFTVESGMDYEDGWLPTLDTNLRVEPNNQVAYKYFEKPTTTNTTIRVESAMAENPKIQTLTQDLVRRLFTTKEDLHHSLKARIINEYTQKILNGGFSKEQTRRIVVAGIKGYYAKLRRRRKGGGGTRIHQTAQESSSGRYKKKLTGKSSWFKTRRTQGEEDDAQGRHGATRRTHGRKTQMTHGQVKTRSVLFVPQTPGGVLARNTKETLDRLEAVMGYKVKVVERAGTSLQNMFSQTSIWDGMDCGRGECVPCNQGGGET